MAYNPATDFSALWRNIAGQVSKLEMPTLDLVVSALARAGVITLSVSATAPVVSQSTTAWLRAAVPSYSAEGALFLWNPATSAYAAASPALFFEMLQATTGQNGASWWTAAGGPPSNTVGNNGDFAIRTDEPGGIYGPKVAGAWPADPIPGTTDIIGSTQLDQTFGTAEGNLIVRGPTVWQSLPLGAANALLVSSGVLPQWTELTALLDALWGNAEGSVPCRAADAWKALAPGVAGQVLTTNGPGRDPSWAPRTAEFSSGTSMLFQQTNAPVGWTKQTAINDYGLRVTSGAVGSVSGFGFSSVFAQTAVGNTTLSTAQMPSHGHTVSGGVYGGTIAGLSDGANHGTPIGTAAIAIDANGGGGAHSHSINLTLSYVDVIIAVKN